MTPFTTTDVVLVGKAIDKLHATIPEYHGAVRQVRRHPARRRRPSIPTSCSRTFPVQKFEDINGKKIATAGAALQWIRGTRRDAGREQHDALLQRRQDRRHRRLHHLPVRRFPGMKYPEAAPYVTKVGFGAQYAAALIINKGVHDKLPPELQTILREAAQAWTAAADEAQQRHLQQGLRLGAEKFPGAQTFELPREEQAKWANAMPNIAKEWAERIDEHGLPGTKALCRLHGRDAQAPAPSRCATGTRTELARRRGHAVRGRRPTPHDVDEGAPEPGAPRCFDLRQRDAGAERHRHAADPGDGGRGQCRRRRPQPLQPSDPRRHGVPRPLDRRRSCSCRWRTRCARAGTFRTTFSPSLSPSRARACRPRSMRRST